jgi:hypothetical protein
MARLAGLDQEAGSSGAKQICFVVAYCRQCPCLDALVRGFMAEKIRLPEIRRVSPRASINVRNGGWGGIVEIKDSVHQRHMRESLGKVADQAFLA